ncbi:MAG: methyltransferase [Candidatus Paceibacterota bacterium]
MDFINKQEKDKNIPRVHKILAQSYAVYLFALVLGIICSAIWPIKLLFSNFLLSTSPFILIFASLLILWSQKSSKKFGKEEVTKKSFMNGPYRFVRNPTNLGIFLSFLSFGIIVNSIFIILFTLISFFISSLYFLKKEEKILQMKYGEAYLEYKKTVRF